MDNSELYLQQLDDPTGKRREWLTTRFEWVPAYRGQRRIDVFLDIWEKITEDQLRFSQAMAGSSDEHELKNLATVVQLDQQWGQFDENWSTANARDLATEIMGYDVACDATRKVTSYQEFQEGLVHTQRFEARHGRSEMVIDEIYAKYRPLIIGGLIVIILVVVLLLF